jgi:hypothetical protein
VEARPQEHVAHKKAAHDALERRVAAGKGLGAVRESLDEAALVPVAKQPQRKRLARCVSDALRIIYKHSRDHIGR